MSVETAEDATEFFEEHRNHLFSVGYSIMGTVSDTEDVLQDAWLAWTTAQRDTITNPRAYLARIVVNNALRRLKASSRETYIGPWLPEPLITEADAAEPALQRDSVSMAMMVMLEALSPNQRAVFVLNEVFGYRHAEVAEIVGKTPEAVRQMMARARKQVRGRERRYTPDPAVQRKVTERFLDAANGGDVKSLLDVLAPDVELISDGGGKVRAAMRVINGSDKVGRFLAGIAPEFGSLSFRPAVVNGESGIAAFYGEQLYAVGVLEVDDDGRIAGMYGVLNPEKLTHLRTPPTARNPRHLTRPSRSGQPDQTRTP